MGDNCVKVNFGFGYCVPYEVGTVWGLRRKEEDAIPLKGFYFGWEG